MDCCQRLGRFDRRRWGCYSLLGCLVGESDISIDAKNQREEDLSLEKEREGETESQKKRPHANEDGAQIDMKIGHTMLNRNLKAA